MVAAHFNISPHPHPALASLSSQWPTGVVREEFSLLWQLAAWTSFCMPAVCLCRLENVLALFSALVLLLLSVLWTFWICYLLRYKIYKYFLSFWPWALAIKNTQSMLYKSQDITQANHFLSCTEFKQEGFRTAPRGWNFASEHIRSILKGSKCCPSQQVNFFCPR